MTSRKRATSGIAPRKSASGRYNDGSGGWKWGKMSVQYPDAKALPSKIDAEAYDYNDMQALGALEKQKETALEAEANKVDEKAKKEIEVSNKALLQKVPEYQQTVSFSANDESGQFSSEVKKSSSITASTQTTSPNVDNPTQQGPADEPLQSQ